jgi:hypothetical protein
MTTKIGYAQGTCPVCGRLILRKRPADYGVCDCYKYCPLCSPAYTVPMTPYTPDLTPTTYESEKGIDVLYYCPNHSPPYYSKVKPVEVKLT